MKETESWWVRDEREFRRIERQRAIAARRRIKQGIRDRAADDFNAMMLVNR